MGDADHGAVVFGVGGQQAVHGERCESGADRLRQVVNRHPVRDGAAVFIDGDQTEQAGDDLLRGAARGGDRFGQGPHSPACRTNAP